MRLRSRPGAGRGLPALQVTEGGTDPRAATLFRGFDLGFLFFLLPQQRNPKEGGCWERQICSVCHFSAVCDAFALAGAQRARRPRDTPEQQREGCRLGGFWWRPEVEHSFRSSSTLTGEISHSAWPQPSRACIRVSNLTRLVAGT